MKISKSKQELARIISENGGWRDGAESAAQSKSDNNVSFYCDTACRAGDQWWGSHVVDGDIWQGKLIPNWHQTILSRAEYFHLYPAPDADGWLEWKGEECPVDNGTMLDLRHRDGGLTAGVSAGVMRNFGERDASCSYWANDNHAGDIIAYRLHKQAKPEFCESVMRSIPDPAAKPTIEQLAADYRNAKDYADSKQQEADVAKADADEALRKLELAGEAIGLLVSPITAKQEPELVITDWRQWEVGDFISWSIVGHIGEFRIIAVHHDPSRNIGDFEVEDKQGGVYRVYGNECRFIRHP